MTGSIAKVPTSSRMVINRSCVYSEEQSNVHFNVHFNIYSKNKKIQNRDPPKVTS